MLIITYLVLLKLLEKNPLVKKIYEEPEHDRLAGIYSGTSILVFGAMVALPIGIPSGALANLLLSALLFLLVSNFVMVPMIRAADMRMTAMGKQIEALKGSIENFNGIKHDFYNILSTYSGFMEVESWDKLKKYHQKVTGCALGAGIALDLSKKMDRNPALATLLMHKAEYAKGQEVKLQMQLMTDIGSIGMDDIDLCRLVSCLVDNAIESAAKSARKSVVFSLTNNMNVSKTITVSNSTKDAVDVEKISVLGASTKEGHMGVGVNNSLKIARSNENCSLSFSYFDHEFTAIVDIKNRPSLNGGRVCGPAFEHLARSAVAKNVRKP
jgi:two-component system sensor histidine kinase AgrC